MKNRLNYFDICDIKGRQDNRVWSQGCRFGIFNIIAHLMTFGSWRADNEVARDAAVPSGYGIEGIFFVFKAC